MNCALPLVQLETTPPIDPASSPVLVLKTDDFSMIFSPSADTVEAVADASADFARFGYGMEPAAPAAPGLQTSGNTGDWPPFSRARPCLAS